MRLSVISLTIDPFGSWFDHSALASFKTDIKDNGDSYTLEADLPGFDKKDIHLDVNGDMLTIHAERKAEQEEKDDKNNYVRCERSFGSYSRQFDLSSVDADHMKATYDNGVLKLEMPKKALPDSARHIEIDRHGDDADRQARCDGALQQLHVRHQRVGGAV